MSPALILRQAQDKVWQFKGLDLMVSLSRFGGLTVRPWAASFFSSLPVLNFNTVRE